jgi:hypothetical protein
MNYCSSCGNALTPGARFCGACGENIRQTPVPGNAVLPAEKPASLATGFRIPNSQQRIVNLWLILGALFLCCMFLPSLIGLDGMDGGFAISFLAGFMVLSSLVVILVYRSRAKQLDRILSGQGRVAVWQYSPEEWMHFTAIDFEEEKKAKKFLFLLVSAISMVIGVLLLLVVRDILILLISLAIIPLVAVPAFLVPRMRYRKLLRSEHKALIAENGVIVGKMFHLWVKLGAALDQVILITDEQPAILEFHYSMPTRTGRQEEVARVPVPAGKTGDAARIAEYFNNRAS